MKSVEVQKDNERMKMNDGTFELKISGTLIKDYQNTWEKNPMGKFLRGTYDKYIVEGTIKQYSQKLFGDVEELLAQVKDFIVLTGTR